MKDFLYIIAAFDTLRETAGGLQFFHFWVKAKSESTAYNVGMDLHWDDTREKLSHLDGNFVMNDYVVESRTNQNDLQKDV